MPEPRLSPIPIDMRLLGPVRLVVGGRRLRLSGHRTQTILAVLAVERGVAVSPQHLGRRVWDDEPPPTYRSSLQNQIARIRAAIRAAGVSDTDLLRTESGCYRLLLRPGECDLHRFTEARTEAVMARDRGDYEGASGAFRRALAEWSGDALAGLPAARFVDGFRVRMEEERRQTVIDRIDMDIACGRAREVIGELRVMTGESPTGVAVWSRYVTALYLGDRAEDAAGACRVILDRLHDQGMDAPQELRALQERILRHESLPGIPVSGSTVPDGERPTLQESLSAIMLASDDGQVIAVTEAGVSIGRGVGNDLRLADPKISRRHARVDCDGERAHIADLGSANGVYVNDRRITSATPLEPGDTIRLGSTVLKVRLSEPDR
ncbi:BTAD domain-containing putative transcriptional regulator [Nocardia carnea]|uniref:BTAD domain-containing putative transcriptional regulator n=1 Tax=Nocardia carnea TaxID=37328 RepID=UPI0024571CFE|nr:BTAD domain-containing putative transcriptional regulator [Nocardia carnea]